MQDLELESGTRYWRRNLVLMWLSQLLILAGFDAAITFIPLLMREELHIISESERGIWVSIFSFSGVLAYAVFCPIWGALSDRFGVKIMLLRGSFVTAFLFPMMGYVTEPWQLIVLRFATAACAGTTAAAQILTVKTTPDNRQGLALGIFSTAVWGGSAIGNVMGGMLVHYYGYKFTFWACGILYFAAGIICLFAKDPPRMPKIKEAVKTKKSQVRRYKHSLFPGFTYGVWLMMILLFFMSFARRFEFPYVPMLIELIDGPEKAAYWTGIISAAVSIGALLSGAVIGYLADKWRPQVLLIPGFLFSVLFLIIQGLTNNLLVFGTARTLMYFFAGGLYPVCQKILAGATPQRKRGSVFGWASSAGNLGVMFSTFIAGWTIFLSGTRGVFITAAIITLLLLPFALGAIHRAMHQPYYIAHGQKRK